MECKSHERPWRDWAVDRNLDNQWLERLNKLETLNLVSICEGHIDVKLTSVKRRPVIIVRPKEAYMRPLTVLWYDLKEALADAIENIWPSEETIIEFEIQHRIMKDGGCKEDREDIILRISSRQKRETAFFPNWVEKWFSGTVSKIEEFDRFFENLMADREGQSK